MTVLDIMGRVGTDESGLAMNLINDAIEMIQSKQDDFIEEKTISIVADQRDYDISSDNVVRIVSVWQLNSSGDYVPCKQTSNVPTEEE